MVGQKFGRRLLAVLLLPVSWHVIHLIRLLVMRRRPAVAFRFRRVFVEQSDSRVCFRLQLLLLMMMLVRARLYYVGPAPERLNSVHAWSDRDYYGRLLNGRAGRPHTDNCETRWYIHGGPKTFYQKVVPKFANKASCGWI